MSFISQEKQTSSALVNYLTEDILSKNENYDKKRIKFIFGQDPQEEIMIHQQSQFIPEHHHIQLNSQQAPDFDLELIQLQANQYTQDTSQHQFDFINTKTTRQSRNPLNRVKFNEVIEVYETENLNPKPNYSKLSDKTGSNSMFKKQMQQAHAAQQEVVSDASVNNRLLKMPMVEFMFTENALSANQISNQMAIQSISNQAIKSSTKPDQNATNLTSNFAIKINKEQNQIGDKYYDLNSFQYSQSHPKDEYNSFELNNNLSSNSMRSEFLNQNQNQTRHYLSNSLNITQLNRPQSIEVLNQRSDKILPEQEFNLLPIRLPIKASSTEFIPNASGSMPTLNTLKSPNRRRIVEIKSNNQQTKMTRIPIQQVYQEQPHFSQARTIESSSSSKEIELKEHVQQQQIPIQINIQQPQHRHVTMRQENSGYSSTSNFEHRLSFSEEEALKSYQKSQRRSSKINDENNIGELNNIFNKIYSRNRLGSLGSLNEAQAPKEANKRNSAIVYSKLKPVN